MLHSAPGFPAFPVRLASEMVQRAMELRGGGRATVWDPCCGSGYLLTVIGLLHRRRISAVLASDVDPAAVGLAERNLALLTASRADGTCRPSRRAGRALGPRLLHLGGRGGTPDRNRAERRRR
ncbi:hypothetical protein [Microbispora sp. KK1-11]|uniref:hypothetical protein n=1 Tax=Microbispora sp. KK1-11 TaxID=2053005 RepID=UPI0028AD18F3|nr:hypothetical protein [Microbispora sp. KK1-11]